MSGCAWQTLEIGNVFKPTFGLKFSQYFQCEENTYNFLTVLLISIFLHEEKLHHYTSLDLEKNLVSNRYGRLYYSESHVVTATL